MTSYVLDTSVLLSYGKKSFTGFEDEDEVIIPLVVVQELEAKRHSDVGLMARSVLRYLDDLTEVGDLSTGVLADSGIIVSVHLNDVYCSSLPESMKNNPSNDTKIISVAANLGATLLTNDIPMRVQASSVGVSTDRFVDRDWDVEPDIEPYKEIWMDTEDIDDLYNEGSVEADTEFPINTNLIIKDLANPQHTALAISKSGWELKLVSSHDLHPSGSRTVSPRNAMQKLYIAHLLDPSVKIITAGGVPGGGKTLLAMACGQQLVKEGKYDKMMVFKSVQQLRNENLGFLPGSEEEKFSPIAESIFDATCVYAHRKETEKCIENGTLDINALSHIRGRTFSNCIVLVTECQNLELSVLLSILTRMGKNSKIILDFDLRQRDNLNVGMHQGIYEVIQRFQGQKMFANVTMLKSERSDVADLAYNLLSDLT